MNGSARRLPWSPVVLIPSTMPGSFSMRRRTLYRALAVTLALAALGSLLAAPAPGRNPSPRPVAPSQGDPLG